jgi:hypothetical protein
MMSLISGSVVDTISPRITSGNPIYLTKNDNIGAVLMNLNPIVTTGQTGAFSIAPAFTSGIANENMSLTTATGAVFRNTRTIYNEQRTITHSNN